MTTNELELAWLAGIVDGEGYVGVNDVRGRYISPEIAVGMTHEETINRVLALTGVGSIKVRPAQKVGWKSSWTWEVYGPDASMVASVLLPYSVTKKQQLTMMTMVPAGSRSQRDESRLLLRHWFADASRSLNQKGA